MVDFKDRVAVITGAGGGLGREHALLLAGLGAAVVVNDLGGSVDGTGAASSAADAVVAEIVAAGGAAVAEYSSVATPDGGAAIVRKALDEFGRLDVVINNAGILRDKSFANMEGDQVTAVLNVHLRGAFWVTRAAWPHMREQSYGRVLMTSSASGAMGNFGQSNYGAAKMGLIGLMNVLKLEGAKYNIKVNAIAPIAVTRMTEELLGSFGITADQFGPQAVSPAVAYLTSESCDLTGEIWSVGGGSVSRIFVGLTDGFFKHPTNDGQLATEDVVENLDLIRDTANYLIPTSNQDEFQKLGAKLLA
jgi:NAD(P)-dependent dehydrogenase (short-subunit alcohol dehydrogenase family)